VLKLDKSRGAPALNIFGGKITTYRCLAESALEEIEKVLPVTGKPWTAGVPLPGGDFPVDGVEDLIAALRKGFAFLDDRWARRMVRAYGTEAAGLLEGAQKIDDLGIDFGATLTEREVAWLMAHEYVRRADDVVWRRSKLGLRMTADQIATLDSWITERARAMFPAAAE
jgi:glycerol-3-phosphate dehydrogenase